MLLLLDIFFVHQKQSFCCQLYECYDLVCQTDEGQLYLELSMMLVRSRLFWTKILGGHPESRATGLAGRDQYDEGVHSNDITKRTEFPPKIMISLEETLSILKVKSARRSYNDSHRLTAWASRPDGTTERFSGRDQRNAPSPVKYNGCNV